MRLLAKILLPFLILIGGALLSAFLVKLFKKSPPETENTEPPRVVEILVAKKETVQFKIRTSGFVKARAQSTVSAQVAGRINSTHEQLYPGEFFQTDVALFTIDPTDYEISVTLAKARVADAKSLLAEEQARSSQAIANWKRLGKVGEPNAMVARKPQLEKAQQTVIAAEAEQYKAETDLARTTIKAPFDALVRERLVDVGHYVNPGTPLATVWAVDFAEVRLPIDLNEVPFLDLPRYTQDKNAKPLDIELHFDDNCCRSGQIIRTENVVDENTRSLYAVARIKDPYLRQVEADSTVEPIPIGQFVECTIPSRPIPALVKLPRKALRDRSQIVLVDSNDLIEIREIEVIYGNDQSVYIEGVETGERIVLTSPAQRIKGEKVVIATTPETNKPSTVK